MLMLLLLEHLLSTYYMLVHPDTNHTGAASSLPPFLPAVSLNETTQHPPCPLTCPTSAQFQDSSLIGGCQPQEGGQLLGVRGGFLHPELGTP